MHQTRPLPIDEAAGYKETGRSGGHAESESDYKWMVLFYGGHDHKAIVVGNQLSDLI